MKKTLILAFSLLGLASSASALMIPQSKVGFTDFSTLTADYGSLATQVTIAAPTESLDYYTLTLPNGVSFASKGSAVSTDNTEMTFAIVLDAEVLATKWSSLGHQVLDTGSWGFGITTDGKVQGCWTDSFWSGTNYPISDPLSTTGTITLTVSTGYHGTAIIVNNETLYFPQDSTGRNGLRGGETITEIKINDDFASAIKEFYMYNAEVQTVEGSKSLYVIPEPATATLSLLALAGLAARRRRK